jgi:hypothetical protein
VLEALRAFPKGSVAGPSGWQAQHLPAVRRRWPTGRSHLGGSCRLGEPSGQRPSPDTLGPVPCWSFFVGPKQGERRQREAEAGSKFNAVQEYSICAHTRLDFANALRRQSRWGGGLYPCPQLVLTTFASIRRSAIVDGIALCCWGR